MKNTENYGLNKPDSTDMYNVAHFNENMDTIDAKIKSIEDGKLDKDTFDTQKNLIHQSITNMDADLDKHIGNPNNPHSVTKAQVGLGEVDNTSDADKPISKAVQKEIDAIKQSIIDVDAINEATGSPILLTDTADGTVSDFRCFGRSTQRQWSGFDGVMSQGHYATDGSITSFNDRISATNLIPCNEGERIRLVYGEVATRLVILFFANGTYSSQINGDNISELYATVPSGATKFGITILKSSGITPSTASEITLTVNGALSYPNPYYPQEIESVADGGWFDGELLQGFYNSSNGIHSTTNTSAVCSKNTIPCKEGDVIKVIYPTTLSQIRICYYNNGTFSSFITRNNVSEYTFTAPSNATEFNITIISDTDLSPTTAKKIVVTINDTYALQVKSIGKNMYDYTKSTNNTKFHYEDGTTASLDTVYVSIIKCEGGKTHTISKQSADASYHLRVCCFDGNNNFISRIVASTASSVTFTPPSNTEYLELAIDMAIKELIQLEAGDAATPYEPYKETVSYIPLSAPLRSSLDETVTDVVSLGENKATRKYTEVVLDGTNLTMTYADSNIAFILLSNIGNNSICSHFNYRVDNRISDNQSAGLILQDGEFSIRTSAHDRIYFKKSDLTTLDEWKAWLQANPITVQYELAEPIEEIIEPVDIVTYDNVTYLTASDNADMWVEYYSNSSVGQRLAKTDEEMKAEHNRLQEQITDIKTVKNIVYKKSGITGAVQIGAKVSGSVVEFTVYRQKLSEVEFYLPDLFADGYAPNAVKYVICTCINAQGSNSFTGVLHIAVDGTCSLYDLNETQITSDLEYTLLIFNTTWIVG